MKAATAAIIFTALLSFGLFSTFGGGKVRGENGTGQVNQHWVDANKYW